MEIEKGEGQAVVGRALRKQFDGDVFEGVVTAYDAKDYWYKVKYSDGDEEELDWGELKTLLLPQGTTVGVSLEDAEASAHQAKKDYAAITDGQQTEVVDDKRGEGEKVVGRALRKNFDGKEFDGIVTSFDSIDYWYKVKYSDGDEEDLEWSEVKGLLLPEGTVSVVTLEDVEASASRAKKEKEAQTPTAGNKRKKASKQEDEPSAKRSSTRTPKDSKKAPQPKTPASEKGKKKEKKVTEEEKDEEEMARVEKEMKANFAKKVKLEGELQALSATIQKQEDEKSRLLKRREERETEWLATQAALKEKKSNNANKREEVLREVQELLELIAVGGRLSVPSFDQIDSDKFWEKSIGPKVTQKVKDLTDEWQKKEKILEDAKQAANKKSKLLKDLGLTPTPEDLAAERAEKATFEVAKSTVAARKAHLLQQVATLKAKDTQTRTHWQSFRNESKAIAKEDQEVEESKPKKLKNKSISTPAGLEYPQGGSGPSGRGDGIDLNGQAAEHLPQEGHIEVTVTTTVTEEVRI